MNQDGGLMYAGVDGGGGGLGFKSCVVTAIQLFLSPGLEPPDLQIFMECVCT